MKLFVLSGSVAVLALTAFSLPTNAATFSFFFNNEDGAIAGTVEGKIQLPNGDGTFPATAVIVTSAPDALGYTIPVNLLDGDFPYILENTFTVSGGEIVSSFSTFAAINTTEGLFVNLTGIGSFLNIVGTATVQSGVWDSDSSTLTFIPATSEPSGLLALLGLGLSALVSRKKVS